MVQEELVQKENQVLVVPMELMETKDKRVHQELTQVYHLVL